MGGHDGPMVRKSVEVYNPELNQWSQVADMTLCRRNAGMSMIIYTLWMLIGSCSNTGEN